MSRAGSRPLLNGIEPNLQDRLVLWRYTLCQNLGRIRFFHKKLWTLTVFIFDKCFIFFFFFPLTPNYFFPVQNGILRFWLSPRLVWQTCERRCQKYRLPLTYPEFWTPDSGFTCIFEEIQKEKIVISKFHEICKLKPQLRLKIQVCFWDRRIHLWHFKNSPASGFPDTILDRVSLMDFS